jgi:3-deoxy-manno-octulosonate cytidylyltransferase (CMP-KDO synthetase)
MPNSLIVIPARMASTRFPGKPKALIAGRSMIERVWRIAKAVPSADRVVIATDDEGLKSFCEAFGAEVAMTSPACLTGTDRVAEVACGLPEYDIVFNLQGDAVLTPPHVIDALLSTMKSEPEAPMATPIVHLKGSALSRFIESKRAGSTTGTTVVFDLKGYAMYFSKTILPNHRDPTDDRTIFRHIGLYAYRPDVLAKFASLPEGRFERIEKLEYLRLLENGIRIRCVEVDMDGRTMASVDEPKDVPFVESLIAKEGELLP